MTVLIIALRRAKAKLLQNKKQEVRPRAQSAPDIPPELSKGSQSDIIALIHEDARMSCYQLYTLQLLTGDLTSRHHHPVY